MPVDAAVPVPRRVFVTGANGFIGRALLRRYRELGVAVCGMDVRADPDWDVVAGDLGAPGAWQAQARGCDLVVNTAAVVSNVARRPRSIAASASAACARSSTPPSPAARARPARLVVRRLRLAPRADEADERARSRCSAAAAIRTPRRPASIRCSPRTPPARSPAPSCGRATCTAPARVPGCCCRWR